MKLVWSPLALGQVEELAEYIASDDAAAAERWLAGLFAVLERLEDYPESGRPVPEIRRPGLREAIYGNDRAVYRIRSPTVAILTVRHGRRLLRERDLG
jgi:plasmid stabilization system protein ParE